MIDIKVSIGFSIINLTEFEGHELQDIAQKVARMQTYHCIPDQFSRLYGYSVETYHAADLHVFVRRRDNAIEFLCVQISELEASVAIGTSRAMPANE